MEILFGLGLSFGLIFAIPALLLLFIAFVYVRAQRGQGFDIGTGLTLYASTLLGLSAVVVAVGLGLLLTALMAQIDEDYTYGPEFSSSFEGDVRGASSSRQERDSAAGLGLVVAGGITASLHIWLRAALRRKERLDDGAEGAVEVVMAFAFGLVAVLLIGSVFHDSFERAIADDSSVSPGGTIAQMCAFIALWALYGLQVLNRARVISRA